jgi:DNA-binding transcriptional LysR family regulator
MTTRAPDWEELRTFREVMREGGLSGAARRLGVAQPTVGRRMDALEAALGVALFARSPRGLSPTKAARDLSPHVEAMAAASAALTRTAAGEAGQDRGVVRVTASEVIGAEVLPPIFSRFRAVHPNVEIELALTNRTEDLSRLDADIAVRMVRPRQAALQARRVGMTRIGLYAHRDYLARVGAPASLAELRDHRMIGYDRETMVLRSLGPLVQELRRDDFVFRCDNDLAQLAALRAGVGIGGAQENIAQRTPELVRLFAEEFSISLEIWLAAHEDVLQTPRVRNMFDALAEGLISFVRGGADD